MQYIIYSQLITKDGARYKKSGGNTYITTNRRTKEEVLEWAKPLIEHDDEWEQEYVVSIFSINEFTQEELKDLHGEAKRFIALDERAKERDELAVAMAEKLVKSMDMDELQQIVFDKFRDYYTTHSMEWVKENHKQIIGE
jgi:hypothetical protein